MGVVTVAPPQPAQPGSPTSRPPAITLESEAPALPATLGAPLAEVHQLEMHAEPAQVNVDLRI